MRFPIDTSGLRFVVVAPGEPLRRYDADCPRDSCPLRRDDDDEVLWRVPLVALGDDDEVVVRVTVAGDPELEPGAMVTVDQMTARTWRLDGRSGVSLQRRRNPGASRLGGGQEPVTGLPSDLMQGLVERAARRTSRASCTSCRRRATARTRSGSGDTSTASTRSAGYIGGRPRTSRTACCARRVGTGARRSARRARSAIATTRSS